MISVVIPLYNEQQTLLKNQPAFQALSAQAELIFVDGASTDKSRQIALSYGKLLSSPRGRAAQMNLGARFARGEILLFLHADSTISPSTLETIEQKIKYHGLIGGCLSQRIDNDLPVFRLIENFGNIRARLTRIFYGDQGIFVRKDIFMQVNGFAPVPIMEDALFSRSIRSLGKTTMLEDKILVSARRWEREGLARTILLYLFINILFFLKAPLSTIKSFYEDL